LELVVGGSTKQSVQMLSPGLPARTTSTTAPNRRRLQPRVGVGRHCSDACQHRRQHTHCQTAGTDQHLSGGV